MAEKNTFNLGFMASDFAQLKTTDNIYLKDILSEGIQESLDLYNSRTSGIANLVAYRFDDSRSNSKKLYSSDSFSRIDELETPGTRNGIDAWNLPLPIDRYGSLTGITSERVKLMSSGDLLQFHNGKLIADQKNTVKKFFEVCCTKAPSAIVDCLDGMATEYKPFWNDEASMDTPRPNGQITFDGDHDHYKAVAVSATVTETEIDTNLISNIREHEDLNNGVTIILWARQGTTFNYLSALSSYKAVVAAPQILGNLNPAYLESGTAQALVTSMKNQSWNVNIRGTYKEAICIETPDLPAGYILATAYFGDNSNMNPVGWREHPQFKGLMLMSPSGLNPVIGKDSQYRRYLGLGVQNRSAGAVLYTVDTTWAEPSFS